MCQSFPRWRLRARLNSIHLDQKRSLQPLFQSTELLQPCASHETSNILSNFTTYHAQPNIVSDGNTRVRESKARNEVRQRSIPNIMGNPRATQWSRSILGPNCSSTGQQPSSLHLEFVSDRRVYHFCVRHWFQWPRTGFLF